MIGSNDNLRSMDTSEELSRTQQPRQQDDAARLKDMTLINPEDLARKIVGNSIRPFNIPGLE